MKLTTKFLTTTIPVIVFAIAVMAGLAHHVASRALEASQTKNLEQICAQTVTGLDIWFADRERELRIFRGNAVFRDAIRTGQLDQARLELERIQRDSPFYENVFLTDRSGKLIADSIGGKSVGIELMKMPEFRMNVERGLSRELWVGDLVKSPATGRPVVLATAPILDQDGVVGLLGMPIDVKNHSEAFVTSVRIGKTGYVYVVNARGLVVFHKDDTQILSADITRHAFGKRIVEKSYGVTENEGSATRERMAFKRLERSGWTVIAAEPLDELLEGARGIAWVIWGIGVAAIAALGLLLVLRLRATIVIPIQRVLSALQNTRLGILDSRELRPDSNDEIGVMARELDAVLDGLGELVRFVDAVGDGELRNLLPMRSENDQIASAVNKTVIKLRQTLGGIIESVSDVSARAKETSDASQALSQGATEQASAIEQISSSVTQIGAQARSSAEGAGQANQLVMSARDAAAQGQEQMKTMVGAMQEITSSSQQIGKIIKVIDDIAFQTNLLALNAAVEAARAGKHGKGFAVVAEEVRNLAGRSAKAARETAELIESSTRQVENGLEVVQQTSKSFDDIAGSVMKTADLIAEIAAASQEGAQGISQVSQGLGQIDQVTQRNTASAEELAAGSQELDADASKVKQLLQRFRLVERGSEGFEPAPEPRRLPPSLPAGPKRRITYDALS